MTVFQLDEFDDFPTGARRLGQLGEEIAARHVQGLGWEIIKQNWSCPQGEIDIIARDGQSVVFLEVRTRRGRNALDLALESIDQRKRERLLMLAELYQEQHLGSDEAVRIDVVGVAVGPDGLARVEVVQDAVGW